MSTHGQPSDADRFRVEAARFDDPHAASLFASVQDYYVQLYGGHDRDPIDPDEFVPPRGLFLIGYLDGAPVACGGWRTLDATAVEIKRMYVADDARGQGLARRLLGELERRALAAGAQRVLLNTGYRQTEAIALYESAGYAHTTQRYGTYADIEGAYFFAKDLTG